jgi:hypothetical protein
VSAGYETREQKPGSEGEELDQRHRAAHRKGMNRPSHQPPQQQRDQKQRSPDKRAENQEQADGLFRAEERDDQNE